MQDKKHNKKLQAKPLLSGVEDIRQDFEDALEGGTYTYGIEILDDAVNTIRKGSTTFIIARPNTGKSLFGLRIATNLAKQGLRVLICSCEMGAGLLIEREIKRLCGISNWELQRLYTESRDYANKILDSLIEDEEYSFLSKVEVTETAGATVYDMVELFELEKYDCIVIDYIQRISGTGTEYEVISNSARELQNYARRSRVPLIICSQAKRGNDSNKDDIDGYEIRGKGSGSIEEDADVGITLMELFENNEKFILVSLFKNRYSHIKRLAYKYKLDSRLNLTLIKKNME